jgi:hypothetical protein
LNRGNVEANGGGVFGNGMAWSKVFLRGTEDHSLHSCFKEAAALKGAEL